MFRLVDADDGVGAPAVGHRTPLNDAYCARVLAGTMPALIPSTREEPLAVLLDVTLQLQIGSYLGVPLHGPDGVPNGMLCLISSGPSPELDDRSLTTAQLVAQVIDDLHHRALGESAARAERASLHAGVTAACRGEGWSTVLQPIVDLTTGRPVAGEALTRFADASRTPAGWFAAARGWAWAPSWSSRRRGAAVSVLERDQAPGTVTTNLSPEVVLDGLGGLLAGTDPSRVMDELTEHAPVRDYDALAACLAPLRARGLRVAVDDVGAGYSSMSHVLSVRPDVVEVDMSLVRHVDADPIRQALIGALVRFAAVLGADVVAEGVATADELISLRDLGVGLGQGYFLGKPASVAQWQHGPRVGTVPRARPLADAAPPAPDRPAAAPSTAASSVVRRAPMSPGRSAMPERRTVLDITAHVGARLESAFPTADDAVRPRTRRNPCAPRPAPSAA